MKELRKLGIHGQRKATVPAAISNKASRAEIIFKAKRLLRIRIPPVKIRLYIPRQHDLREELEADL